MPVLPMSIGAVRSEGASRDIPVLQVSLIRRPQPHRAAVLAVFPAKWNASEFTDRSALCLFVVERHGVKLEPVIDQAITEPAGDLRLQALDLVRLELDHGAGAQVDEMIVVGVGNLFVARAALAKIMPLDDAGVFKQLDGAEIGRAHV